MWILSTLLASSEPSVHGTRRPSPSSPATKCDYGMRDGCGIARFGKNAVVASGLDLGFEMQLQWLCEKRKRQSKRGRRTDEKCKVEKWGSAARVFV
jgi:hypothetical protein